MAGLQFQGKSVDSSRAASGSGWGTCADLLLVSAVKKHGVPNWNSVALELKARALMLNIPPSYFTEEACKFKYNALKGKFARNGNSSGSMDGDLNGGYWFEELRKLRVSHLKEELQVYDCSIGQLQTRINRLKEERAQGLKHLKQFESSCGGDACVNGRKTFDFKAPVPPRRAGETSEKSRDLSKFAAPADISSGKLFSAVGLDRRPSVGKEIEAHVFAKNVAASSSPQLTFRESSGDLQLAADRTVGNRALSECARVDDEVAVEVEQDVCSNEHDGTLEVGEQRIRMEEPDQNGQISNPGKTTTSGTSQTVGLDDILQEDITTTKVDDFDKCGIRDDSGVQNEAREDRFEVDQTLKPLPVPASADVAVGSPEHRHDVEASESLIVTSEAPHSVGEIRSGRGGKAESVPKKDPRQSKLSLSYARSEREKRLKTEEGVHIQRISGPEVGGSAGDQPLQRVVESVKMRYVKGTANDEVSILPESGKGNVSSCDPTMPFEGMEAGSFKETVPDFPAKCNEEGRNGVLDSGADSGKLLDEKIAVDTKPPSDLDVLIAPTGTASRNGAGMGSRAAVDSAQLAILCVAPGPKPTHRVAEPSGNVSYPNLDRGLNAKSDLEVPYSGPLDGEAAICAQAFREVKFTDSLTCTELVERKSEGEAPKVTDDEKVEVESLQHDHRQRVEREVERMGVAGDKVEEFLDTGLRSLGDNISETIGLGGYGHVDDESRDGPEIGEVQQSFPDYTDSQIDKSEVGSSLDSIEDMSPSSRKNRREPKVPGKLLPLLECLRVICAHKFAPLFRQRQEYQDSTQYDRLVRRHVDLSMVRTRLEEGAYSGSVEFFRDLLLIFTNALVYSSSDSQEYAGAKVLRRCALVEMDKILQTEALLKQNGPATRKREVRKFVDVHKVRVSSTSGSENRKKGILKVNNEIGAALDLHGATKGPHRAFEDTCAGRSSNNEDDECVLEAVAWIETKKLTTNRVVKEEIPKDLKRLDLPSEGINRSPAAANISSKKMKVEGGALKRTNSNMQAPVVAELRSIPNVESVSVKMAPAKMKDVMCIDVEKRGPLNVSCSLVPSGSGTVPTGKQQTSSILRQNSASRVSRYCKRGGDSTSNPKKRLKK